MNNKLLNEILHGPELPTLPRVAMRVLEISRQEDANFSRLADAMSADPALVAKVLKTVNSSFYGLSQPIKSLNHALVILGMHTIKTLALGFSFVRGIATGPSESFDYVRFWRQSLYTAVFARGLAKMQSSADFEQAFLAGLLSDLGTLVMHRALGSRFDELLSASGGDQLKLQQLSQQNFDLDHAAVGAALVQQWNFPSGLVQPIRNRLQFPAPPAKGQTGEILHSATICAQVFAAAQRGYFDNARAHLQDQFGFSWTQTRDLFADTSAKTSEMASLLEVSINPGRAYEEIEEEAREALIEITLAAQRQAEAALVQNQRLHTLARTDGLTGLSNRRHFTEFLADAFSGAVAGCTPLSLIMLDIDKFKSVNDTYGHQAGDAVLENMGQLVKSMTPKGALSARYGGEEMAIVLKDVSAGEAMEIAEAIRQRAADLRTCLDSLVIPVTASLGVATMDADNAFASPDEIVGAADRALYAAKGAGRNCVKAVGEEQQRDAA
jgi:two-component system, cell cycle response regulator